MIWIIPLVFLFGGAAFVAFLSIPRPIVAVCRRELYTLVNGPIGLVSLVAFLLIAQTMYAVALFQFDEASMRPFFEKIPLAFSLVAPLVAMRIWAEERRTHTIELLLTLPARTYSAVIGKFLAGWAFLAVCLFATFSTPLMLEFVLTEPDVAAAGNPEPAGAAKEARKKTGSEENTAPGQASGNMVMIPPETAGDKTIIRSGPDWGPILGGFAGALLLAAFTLSVGSFTSSLTRDQLVAAILGILICLLLWAFGYPLVVNSLNSLLPGAGSFLAEFSHQRRFMNLAKGLWDWTDVLFFVSGTSAFLWMTAAVVEKQRA